MMGYGGLMRRVTSRHTRASGARCWSRGRRRADRHPLSVSDRTAAWRCLSKMYATETGHLHEGRQRVVVCESIRQCVSTLASKNRFTQAGVFFGG